MHFKINRACYTRRFTVVGVSFQERVISVPSDDCVFASFGLWSNDADRESVPDAISL